MDAQRRFSNSIQNAPKGAVYHVNCAMQAWGASYRTTGEVAPVLIQLPCHNKHS